MRKVILILSFSLLLYSIALNVMLKTDAPVWDKNPLQNAADTVSTIHQTDSTIHKPNTPE